MIALTPSCKLRGCRLFPAVHPKTYKTQVHIDSIGRNGAHPRLVLSVTEDSVTFSLFFPPHAFDFDCSFSDGASGCVMITDEYDD